MRYARVPVKQAVPATTEGDLEIDALCRTYPRLYHMATAGSWPSLRERGLLSTTALLELF